MDHPRSRGEYWGWMLALQSVTGSSPLSRGILHVRPPAGWGIGIIPALAGNTTVTLFTYTGNVGSSPLSRGILPQTLHVGSGGRIIPALAGNTMTFDNAAVRNGDHPRSRGEYQQRRDRHQQWPGSSPLSRGIPNAVRIENPYMGIIPALAGNTGVCCRFRLLRGDHPRSRGEYGHHGERHLVMAGSSPLSRGIPRSPGRTLPWTRIIPALAGNTRGCGVGLLIQADHPRSRGEYLSAGRGGACCRGSSPLSRGILKG